ncbi:MAG: hypothetical protein PSV23_09695 [Brevundimonas sp.]|uniref:hypothetical protein n=1 Tax=Brevundimonas sp. TaxID=1871086 RepID=UPI0024886BF0|nr:hypothetical protein [Brevundimonas sp.]MDI1327054.1 hypothetical protein [Brevundimonas sp.]
MASQTKTLPHWTWEDLEAALNGFSPLGANDPVRAHLMRGLADDAERANPRELLQQVLSAGWVMAQVGAQRDGSGTDLPRAVGASVS